VLTRVLQEKSMTNVAADDSSSEEVIVRRKPIPKPPPQQVYSSSEDEAEQVRAASLGLRVRAKVNYKEKGEKDVFRSDDEEMVSAPMQVLIHLKLLLCRCARDTMHRSEEKEEEVTPPPRQEKEQLQQAQRQGRPARRRRRSLGHQSLASNERARGSCQLPRQ